MSVRKLVVLGLVLVSGAAAGGGLYVWLSHEETITVRAQGMDWRVPEGATLAVAVRRLGIAPQAGDLLDVHDAVLRRDAYPGRVLLNGGSAEGGVELQEGDRITAIDGRDRREPVERLTIRVPGGMPSVPQFTLARTPGEQKLLRGRVSRKVVPLAFHATGPRRVPDAVALTFDDGPSLYTSQILAVLRRLRVRATFFVVGELAERRPGVVRRELAAGMEVGSHSYSHPFRPPFDTLPHERIREEIDRGRATLAALGAEVTLFRPPGGVFSGYVLEAAGAYRQRVVLWSLDPGDWRPGMTAKRIARNVLDAVRPGSIVLLHDGGGNRSATMKALPAIIKGIRRRGLRIVLVDGG